MVEWRRNLRRSFSWAELIPKISTGLYFQQALVIRFNQYRFIPKRKESRRRLHPDTAYSGGVSNTRLPIYAILL